MSGTLIKNIGILVSGDINNPILDADAIFISDGKIQKIGKASDLEKLAADTIVDAAGGAITPGLIDSHCHVVLGRLHSAPEPVRIPRERSSWRGNDLYFRGRSSSPRQTQGPCRD